MDEKIKSMVEEMEELAISQIPKIAKIHKLFFDALVKEGFTKEEAMRIVEKSQMTQSMSR